MKAATNNSPFAHNLQWWFPAHRLTLNDISGFSICSKLYFSSRSQEGFSPCPKAWLSVPPSKKRDCAQNVNSQLWLSLPATQCCWGNISLEDLSFLSSLHFIMSMGMHKIQTNKTNTIHHSYKWMSELEQPNQTYNWLRNQLASQWINIQHCGRSGLALYSCLGAQMSMA